MLQTLSVVHKLRILASCLFSFGWKKTSGALQRGASLRELDQVVVPAFLQTMDQRLPGLEPAMKRLKQSPTGGCEPIWSRGGPQYTEIRMANSTSLSTSTTRLRAPTFSGGACSNPLSTTLTAPQGHLLGQASASGFTFRPSHPQQWQLPPFNVSTLPAWFSHISQPHLPGSYQYVSSPQQSGLMGHPSGQPSLLGGLPWSLAPTTAGSCVLLYPS